MSSVENNNSLRGDDSLATLGADPRDSEDMYRRIVTLAHEGIFTLDLNSVVTYVNERGAEMLGYRPDELVGTSLFDVTPVPLHAEGLERRARRHSGVRESFDFEFLHRDGSTINVSIASSPIADAMGDVVGVLHLVSDITARKRMEEALRESETRMRALLKANPDLILRVTRDGRYVDVHCSDPRVEAVLPIKPHELVGRNVSDFFPPSHVRQHERHRIRALTTGKSHRWEYRWPLADGKIRYVEARFVKSGDDEVLIIARDVTSRVELEREVIASSERERTRLGHDLHDGLAQLLTGTKLLLEAMREKLAGERSLYVAEATRACELVTRAVMQAGDLASGLSPIRKGGRLSDALRRLCKQAEQLFGVPCRLAGRDLDIEPGEQTAAHIYRIAQEAVSNAAKHGQATLIEVRTERRDGRLTLTVTDDGRGFETGSDSDGMGLHIMEYRAHSIGGELTIMQGPSGGTVVRCECPLAAEPVERFG